MPTAGGETSVVVVASRPFGHEHSHLSDASFSAPTRGVGGGGGGGGFGVGECEGRMVAVGHEEPHREEESAAAAAATRDSFETADAIDVTDVTTINPTNNNNKENLDPGRDDGASSNAGVGTGTVGDGHDASEQQAAAKDDDDNDDGEAFVPSSPSLSRSSGETTRSEETVESQQPCLFTIDPSRHVERDGDKQPDNRQSLPKDDTSSGSRSEKNPNLHQNDQSSTASTREASHFDVPQIDEPNANDSDASRRADTTQTRDRASSGSSTMQRMRAGMGSALGIDFGSALAADFTPTIQIVEEEDSEDEEDGSVRQASLNAQRQADDDVNEAAAIRSTVRPSSPTAITTPLRQVPPLLCTTIADRSRVPFRGNSCLYPGSTFRGTQTSGRSSYDVEARIVEVDLPGSSVSGYLSISHLTDAHPTLTTFFTGQIVGSKHGFLTCAGPAEEEYGRATEQDDMRHWSRFEHFRKVRNELRRPSLTLRDTVPGMERDRTFLFMRWKERFLVPDHKVKDICGASFAGFYYLQLDMDPSDSAIASKTTTTVVPSNPNSTAERQRPGASGRPSIGNGRRSSHSTSTIATPVSPGLGVVRRASQNTGGCGTIASRSPGKRACSSERFETPLPTRNPPIITGYYFHHQNSEPFQELNLRHIPQRGNGSIEMR